MDKRLLTPAEAALLLVPARATASKCVQAGLLSLLDGGHIAVEQATNPFKQSALLLTAPTAAQAAPLATHVAAVQQALTSHGKGNRLVASQVLHALQKRFGHDLGGYVHDEVAPSLIKRGLLIRSDRKWLGLFPYIRYERTPLGKALAAPLERLMAALESVPSLLESDPDQAMRLARSAGVLLIMSPKTRRQIPKLRKLLADRGDSGASVGYMPLDTEREPGWEQMLEFGDMALAFELDSLFDGVDAVGDFTGGGDGGSSDGGDGGGGD